MSRGRSVPGSKCPGVEVSLGSKCPGVEMSLGSKCPWGQNVPGVKVSSGSKWVGAHVCFYNIYSNVVVTGFSGMFLTGMAIEHM